MILTKKPDTRLGKPNKMQPLNEQEEFEFRLRAEREANSKQSNQPTEKAPFQIPQNVGEAIGTGIGVGGQVLDTAYKASLNPIQRVAIEAVGNVYKPIRDFAVDTIGSGQREVPKILTENSGLANAIETARKKPLIGGNIPVREFRGGKLEETGNIPVNASFEDLQKGVQGIGFDYLAGRFGPKVVSGGVKGAVKNTDKTLTSITRRIGGLTSEDIKSGRRLTSEYGPSKVFSKVKAKPSYVGSQIAPKASEVASTNVRSMRPESIRELGVSSEDTALATELKNKYGLTEFPTKSSADEFFNQVMESADPTTPINTNRIREVLSDPTISVDTKTKSFLNGLLNRTRTNELGVLEPAPISTGEFKQVRSYLNNLDPSGDMPSVQAIKQALDSDAAEVIPQLAEAKGRFQLSRQVPKVEGYLDKQALEKQMESQLKSASSPEAFQAKESLKRLLGDEAKTVLDDLEASRLAGEYYGKTENSGINMGRKAPYEFFRKLTRPIARTYEQGRAQVSSLFSGGPKTPTVGVPTVMTPQISNTKKTIGEVPRIDIDEVQRNVAAFEPKPINVSDEAIANAQADMAKYDYEQGRLPYKPAEFPSLSYEPFPIPGDVYSKQVSERLKKSPKKGR